MEKKKSLIVINIIAIIIIIILGCTVLFNLNKLNNVKGLNKKAITSEEFKNVIEKRGFQINSPNEALEEDAIIKAGIKSGYLTRNLENVEYRINFFEFKDENSEQYMYYDAIKDVRDETNWNAVETMEKSMYHTKYMALTDETCIIISRIGNTLIWGTINANNKQELINLFSEFGY